MSSALLAIDLGFLGPNYSICAACATSNYCFCAAANHICAATSNYCFIASVIAGGVEAGVVPAGIGGFAACRALSQRNDDPQTASRPWNKDRDGFVMGEGAGVLVMESLEHAMKRDAPILAEYLGGAISFDAYHPTNPRSDGLCLSSCIQKCLVDAEVSVEESMIGHCMGAAGGLEAIATINAIQTGWVHPTINQFDLEPEIDFDTVANQKRQHEISVGEFGNISPCLALITLLWSLTPFLVVCRANSRIHLVLGGVNSVVAFSAFKP
ncbi:3-oxoacyl-[acyl-carrier-protein] synthase I, chloroplastic [Tanacetum coccineum]